MIFFDIIYTIIIGPLKLLFEVIYTLAYYMCSSPGLSIIALSLVMNFLVLPLYAKADKMQEEQNNIEKKLHKGVEHIKKTFKGDERYMMLQTYYRQNNYKPTDALKGSISLLLEIPFFMAAYAFLSNLNVLKHASFGPIADLGAPDQMLTLFGITLNVLPILMTLINIVSSYIYTKGLPAKAKVQLYVMAGLFLVLLYDSPSGLVFYWTLNNLFSLVKNIFYKLSNPKLVLSILSSFVSVLGLLFVIIKHPFTFNQTVLVLAVLVVMQLPILFYLFRNKIKLKHTEDKPVDSKIFVISTIALALLTGLLIPTQLINSSPTEFMNTVTMENPLIYVLSSFCLAFGTFVVWCNVFYNLLGGNKVKRILNYLIVIVLFVFVVDYFFFGNNTGIMSLDLRFDNALETDTKTIVNNFIVLFVVVSFITLLLRFNRTKFIKTAESVMIIVLLVLSSLNIYSIDSAIKQQLSILNNEHNSGIHLNLSKDKENVVVLLMDQQFGKLIPFIFNELPYLQEQYMGFTYYANTFSYGSATRAGAAALYGGYEYTPDNQNQRADESLKEKIYESFKVMPVLFNKNNFDVTVFDLTLGATDEIFDEYEDIDIYNSIGNVRVPELLKMKNTSDYDRLFRNVFSYSITKCVPTVFQQTFYNFGAYLSIDRYLEITELDNNFNVYNGVKGIYMDSYQVLYSLSDLTKLNSDKRTFSLIYNLATHDGDILQEPEYEPNVHIDNRLYEQNNGIRISMIDNSQLRLSSKNEARVYQSNAATFIQIGKWLDYLRENDVYDNTRIILVSDHGVGSEMYDGGISNYFDATLMIKDFNSDNSFSIDYSLMSNADTPYIAAKDVIEDIINPFSGKEITDKGKYNNKKLFYTVDKSNPKSSENIYKAEGGSKWYELQGENVFDNESYIELDIE